MFVLLFPSNLNTAVETSAVPGGYVSEATIGSDYTPLSRKIAFAPNDDTETVTVTIIDDGIRELIEYFQVALSDGLCSIQRGSALIIGIADDDGMYEETLILLTLKCPSEKSYRLCLRGGATYLPP